MRIQKYLSEQGICSRRQAEAFIRTGHVLVNGKVVDTLGTQIDAMIDTVTLAPEAQAQLQAKMTVAAFKPRGVTSSRIRSEGTSIFDILPELEHLHLVGRLDKESEGLLLLSDDGALAKQVTGDMHLIEKEYRIEVREMVKPELLQELETGVRLDDGMTLPARAYFENNHTFRLVLKEGRKHQIRRMCDYVHLTVESLKRIRIGPVTLRGLRPGAFRELTPEEVAALKSTRA